MAYFIMCIIGYFLGCSNMATYLAKAKGVDITSGGSGNPGASNATILMGWRAGILVAVHDAGKALVTGKEEGAAQLTFTALQSDETVCFVLDLVVNVDSEGKVFVSSYQHQERKDNSVDADGLRYKWNVDTNGILNFSFINQEDRWSVSGDGADAFVLSNMMSTPSGCKFSAQAIAAGQTTIVLTSENSQRTIHVVIQADDQREMEVVSVQEQ